MDDQAARGRFRTFVLLSTALAAAAFFGVLLIRYLRRERTRRMPSQPPTRRPRAPRPQAVLDLQGLTEAEAQARYQEGQDAAISFKPPYSVGQIWTANILTIFNLSLVGLAAVQVLIGRPQSAFLTTLTLLAGVGLNVAQQLWARWRLQKLQRATRAQATVVREGKVRSIDPSEIVPGDVLVVGPGDQILADGIAVGERHIVVDETLLTGEPGQHTVRTGSPVYAGSVCVAGHGAYQAQKVGSDRRIAALIEAPEQTREELTPLERVMDRLLRILLVIVAVLALFLLADYANLLFRSVHVDTINSAISVVFGLAPSGLFLMILVNYAMGTADLARIGALVHRTRSVESLAQATVVCFARTGILTGIDLSLELAETQGDGDGEDHPRLARSRVRQILGDYARSTSARSPAIHAMATVFPGDRRAVREEMPFLSLYGWSAVVFDDPDLRGIMVLGNPETLEPHLSSKAVQPEPEQPEEAQGPGLLGRLVDQLTKPLKGEVQEAEGEDTEDQEVRELSYLVALHPEVTTVHTPEGWPVLPQDLTPLCRLRYTVEVRPETVEMIHSLSQTGVAIKVFSSDAPEETVAILRQAGLKDEGMSWPAISGPEFAALQGTERMQAAARNAVFGQLTPDQAGQVVTTLREQDEVVAVIGDGMHDLPAMRKANLSITRQGSSPAVLSIADIVLLEGSSEAFMRLVDKGQRIANGLIDILKLYLNQVSYQTLLILAIYGMGLGFPFLSKQGTLINIFSVILPSLALSLWASAGVLPRTRLGRVLARFVAPSAVTVSVAGVIVYRLYLGMTHSVSYAQLVTTYTLAVAGLVLVILLRPPIRWMGSSERSGDWRPTVWVLVILVLLFVTAPLPIMDELLGLRPLRRPVDYLIVGATVLTWATVVSLTWAIGPLGWLLGRTDA